MTIGLIIEKLLIDGMPSASTYINKEGKPIAILRIAASKIEFIGSKPSESDGAKDDIPF